MIKVKKLTIQNVGLIADTVIDINKPLLLFYGDVRQGKSTILSAVRWCLGAAWPSDIIRHGQKEAQVSIEFDGGLVSRSWYVGKDGFTKARDIVFVRDGKPVSRPAKEIEKLLNPFQTNQDYLRNMSEPERKAFFAQVLSVDTANLDAEAAACASQASELRSQLKAYGEIDPIVNIPPDEPPNVEDLRGKLDVLKADYKLALEQNRAQNEAVHVRAGAIQAFETKANLIRQRIARLEQEVVEAHSELDEVLVLLANNPLLEHVGAPVVPEEVTALEREISDAAAAKERYGQWQKEKARLDRKQEAQKDLAQAEDRQTAIKREKAAMLKDYAGSCGIVGLAFDDAGNVIFEDTQAGMLSTSQLMRLSSALASLYPPGFGLDLIDRAESLGKSIYQFIDRAKEKELTILATVVGEAPAQSPPEVGVFVVEEGKVKQQSLL